VTATAEYALRGGDDALTITYSATADAPTPINMCNHAYWNLSGGCKAGIAGHTLRSPCTHYLPVDAGSIPPGVEPVAGTRVAALQWSPHASLPRRLLVLRAPLQAQAQARVDVYDEAGAAVAGVALSAPAAPAAHAGAPTSWDASPGAADTDTERVAAASTQRRGRRALTASWLGCRSSHAAHGAAASIPAAIAATELPAACRWAADRHDVFLGLVRLPTASGGCCTRATTTSTIWEHRAVCGAAAAVPTGRIREYAALALRLREQPSRF
jgi:hypothetical protein